MKLSLENSFLTKEELESCQGAILEAHRKLNEKTGEGSDFLGWVNLRIPEEELARIQRAAQKIREKSDVLVVIGIGGSYLGARAVIDALSHSFFPKNVLFAGNNLSADYMCELLEYLKGKEICLNVISKSGTTTEPAIAFKILRELVEEKYGKEEARERIFITTDREKGLLKEIAIQNGYETFVVPDDIGGRYSVFSPVGLLPIAAAGIDIEELLSGVYEAEDKYQSVENNICYQYATARNLLYQKGKKIELLVNYEPKLHYVSEWWKQLFGESEGKDEKGLFPAGAEFTTDLHSLGQYIQEGRKILFETVINIETSQTDLTINFDEDNLDCLNYLVGKELSYINHKAMEGTIKAHTDGGVPNIIINMKKLDEESIGELIYFFEKACAISAELLEVNPFNQPGVEKYKTNMFKLLEKPGY